MTLWTKKTAHPALGELEHSVLQQIWEAGEVDAQGVHQALSHERVISLSTVQSTLERLHRKDLLHRRKDRRAYLYVAALSREELMGRLVSGVAGELMQSRSAAAISGLLDLADPLDERSLAKLEAWVKAARARRSAQT